jgi:hypothetical protein
VGGDWLFFKTSFEEIEMRVSKTELKTPFTPFELKITVETLQEQIALFCIFNHGSNAGFLNSNHVQAEQIARQLESNHSYVEQHKKLCEIMNRFT